MIKNVCCLYYKKITASITQQDKYFIVAVQLIPRKDSLWE